MRQRYFHVLILAFMACLMFWQVGAMQHVLRWDAVNCFLTWRHNVSEMIRAQHLPLWSPWQHLGFPLHADPETGAWYPVLWVISAFRTYDFYSLNFEWVLHIFIGGLGMFRLLKGMGSRDVTGYVAALSFMGCGIFVSNAQNFIYLIGLAWFPWVVQYLVLMWRHRSGRHVAWFSLCTFMMLTGSYPGISIIGFYCLIAAAAFFLILRISTKQKVWPWLRLNVLAGLLIFCLAAPHLLSVAEYLPHVTRTEGLSRERLLENPFPPRAWVSVLTPYAVGTDHYVNAERQDETIRYAWGSDFSMLNLYSGLLVITLLFAWLAGTGKTKTEWFLFVGFVVLMMLAMGDVFPFRWWTRNLPGLDMFRHPSIFRFHAVFALIFLGSLVLDRWFRDPSRIPVKPAMIFIGAALVTLFVTHLPDSTGQAVTRVMTDLARYPEVSRVSVSDRIFFHSGIQLILLSGLAFALIKRHYRAIALWVAVDMLIAVQLNIHATVVYPMKLDNAQRELCAAIDNRTPYGGEAIGKFASDSCSLRVSGLVCNHHIILQQPAWDGYNSFILAGYRDLEHAGNYPGCFNKALIYSPDTTLQIHNIDISPNSITCNVHGTGKLILQQNHHPNWKFFIRDSEEPISIENETMMCVEVKNESDTFVRFEYSSISTLIGICLSIAGLILSIYLLFKRLPR